MVLNYCFLKKFRSIPKEEINSSSSKGQENDNLEEDFEKFAFDIKKFNNLAYESY